jgi:hypothetical protein
LYSKAHTLQGKIFAGITFAGKIFCGEIFCSSNIFAI